MLCPAQFVLENVFLFGHLSRVSVWAFAASKIYDPPFFVRIKARDPLLLLSLVPSRATKSQMQDLVFFSGEQIWPKALV